MSDPLWALVVALAVDRSSSRDGRTRLRLNRAATAAAQAGLLALVLLFAAFASIGPSFTYWLGLGLLSASATLGALAVAFAHRAGHRIRRKPHEVGGGYAALGNGCGWFAALVSLGYIGLLFVLLVPFVLVLVLALGVTALVLHTDARAGESFFRSTLDVRREVAACGRCGRRIPLASGRWRSGRWLCSLCAPTAEVGA